MFPALILTLLQPLLIEHPERSLEISPTWSFHTDPAFSLLRLKFLNEIRGGLLLHLLCIHSFSTPSDWHHKGCSVIFPADLPYMWNAFSFQMGKWWQTTGTILFKCSFVKHYQYPTETFMTQAAASLKNPLRMGADSCASLEFPHAKSSSCPQIVHWYIILAGSFKSPVCSGSFLILENLLTPMS